MLLPKWINDLPEGSQERKSAEMRFLIHCVSLYASHSGSVKELIRLIGTSPTTMSNAMNTGEFSAKMAIRIETLVGRDVITREELCSMFKKQN